MSVAATDLHLARAGGRAGPKLVIAGHVFRSAVGFALVWGFVFGLFVISTVKAYSIAFPTLADRVKAAATLQSFSILLGQPHHAETLAGFTSWRVTVAVALIGSIWAILTSTGLLRGEEDAGRWEMLLAGPVTKLRASAEALVGLFGAFAAMFIPTALITLGTARLPGVDLPVGASLLFALTLVSGAAMFLAVGALASQLSATRGQAIQIAVAVMGLSFLVRMIADATKGLDWLLWLTPFGWLEEVRPFRDTQAVALVPIVTLVLVCLAATLVLAARRDLGASVLQERGGPRSGGRWLLGPTTLALRLVRGTAIGWALGIMGFSFFTGLVTRSAAALLADSPAFAAVLGRLGVRKASEGYLGFSFFTVAAVLAVLAASQMASLRDEEAAGRLDNLIVRPARRLTWLAGRVAIAASLVVVCGAGAGLAAWLGTESQHTGVPLAKLLEAGLNATVPALFVIGAGALVQGIRPHLVSAACYGVVAYSYLVNLVGTLVKGQDWLRDSSVFSHIKLAPAAKPDWGEASIVILLGVALAMIGATAFTRRDIEYA